MKRTLINFIAKELTFLLLIALLVASYSCHKSQSPEIEPVKNGNIEITFFHKVHGSPLLTDTLIYGTSLDNRYMVNDLQYFVSGISLHRMNGSWVQLADTSGIHYVDADIPSTFQWLISNPFPAGTYDSIGFVFGMDEPTNRSGLFPDPPQRDMFWPDILGGGYHYMKMNLKWKNAAMQETMPFMFHLGIGQMYSGTTTHADSIIGYIQNYFRLNLPVAVEVVSGRSSPVNIVMNIDKWFDGDNAFDFSKYAMGIMQDQQGMYLACQNGRYAFAVQK